ncbi:MAG: serine hydrolase domain-containing protein [Gemmatimonadaceae bacterium]
MTRSLLLIAASVTFSSTCVGQAYTDAPIVKTPLGAKIDSTLVQAERDGFSGVALVAKNGDIILEKGYGMANRAKSIPMTPATIVQIGSNTKDFTAVAVLQLIERGRLKFTDSIGKFFQNVPADKRGATIEMLLKHRAGFPEYMGGDFDPVTRDDEIRHALDAPLRFPPGNGRAYSNVGYSLLGAIIEQISGKSYDEYLRDEILKPAGLENTGFLLPRFDTTRLAHGYSNGIDRGTMLAKPHAADGPYWNLRANGGMLSTVSDMYRFYDVLGGKKLLKAQTRDLMFPPNVPVMLAGSDMVNYFLYDREPQAGIVIILASNAAALNAQRVRDRIAPIVGLDARGGRRNAEEAGNAQSALKDLPNTPAANTVRAYFKAFDSGDPAVMSEFMRTSTIQAPGDTRTIDQRLEGYKRMHDDIGNLNLLGMIFSTAEQIVTRANASNGDTLTLTFAIEPQAPFRIKAIRIEAQ